ncbi:MAG: hypothetical protein IID09_06960 [Candidatus Hydrogenedentes bacterium]|nr:hypothetical protein [Candidatus Hydrogenedentota bacterium]
MDIYVPLKTNHQANKLGRNSCLGWKAEIERPTVRVISTRLKVTRKLGIENVRDTPMDMKSWILGFVIQFTIAIIQSDWEPDKKEPELV